MGKASRDTAAVQDFGAVEERSQDVEGYTINFVNIREGHDLAPILAKLPGGNCSCPHWGYMLAGRMTVSYADHQDVYEPGDAFYMPPGHTPAAESGTEFVMFSPADEYAALDAAMKAAMTETT